MTDFEKEIVYELKEMRLDVNHHIKRTDLLQNQMTWMQWLIPISLTIFGIVMAIIFK